MVSQGWIEWAVKGSFRRYVEALPDGAVEAADGASLDAETFRWPATIEQGGEQSRASGWGVVTLTGHSGLLTVALASPTVVVRGGKGALSIDYPWASASEEPSTVIADLVATAEHGVFAVSLTEDGAELFNTYAAGAEMAPLVLRTS